MKIIDGKIIDNLSQLEVFQKTNYINSLKSLQKEILFSRRVKTSNGEHYIKAAFQNTELKFNKSIQKYPYYINYYKNYKKDDVEFLWVKVLDINLETKTILGILKSYSSYFNIPINALVATNFESISDLSSVK